MNFSEKLFELRKKSGLSQEELADKINVSRQTISKWEMNQSSPEMDKLINLSEIFNISIDELVGNERLEEIKDEEENKDHKENLHPGARRKYVLLKILFYILIIYLAISLFKFILLTRHELIVDSFNEENYSIIETIITHNDTLEENPSYLTVSIDKIGNKYLETQYSAQDMSSKPTVIKYVDTDKKESYTLTYNKEKDKYILFDDLMGFNEERKEEFCEYYSSQKPVKNLSNMNKNLKLRFLNSINPLVFVNPFAKTITAISPFNGYYRYEYNKDYLMSRITIKLWDATNRNSSWTIAYDYVQDHFNERTIENPLDIYEYESAN